MTNRRYTGALQFLRLMQHLLSRPHTKKELSVKLNLHRKSIERMIVALESDNVPVIVDTINTENGQTANTYRLPKNTLRRLL